MKICVVEIQVIKNEYQEYLRAVKRWKSVLSGFVILYQPLGSNESGADDPEPSVSESTLADELNHGSYLQKLYPLVASHLSEMGKYNEFQDLSIDDEEDIVLKIESHCETYYQSIWNSFLLC